MTLFAFTKSINGFIMLLMFFRILSSNIVYIFEAQHHVRLFREKTCLATNKRKWMETFFFRFNIVLMNYLSAKLLYASAISHASITIFTFYLLDVYEMMKFGRFHTRCRSLFIDYIFSIEMVCSCISEISWWIITYALKLSFKRHIKLQVFIYFDFLTFILLIIALFWINLKDKILERGVGIGFHNCSVPFEQI